MRATLNIDYILYYDSERFGDTFEEVSYPKEWPTINKTIDYFKNKMFLLLNYLNYTENAEYLQAGAYITTELGDKIHVTLHSDLYRNIEVKLELE